MITAHLRRWARILTGREPLVFRDVRIPVERHGSVYGGWTLSPGGLDAGSIVYSLGVGEDVSFDVSLLDRFGLTVHAFDPLPRVRDWIRTQSLPDRFRFHPLAVAGRDGELTLHPPVDPTHVSYTAVAEAAGSGLPVRVPARRLATILGDLGHDRVDVLKMDVEGAEYEILEDLVRSALPVSQLLVEFHHRFRGVGLAATRNALRTLRRHGFEVFHVTPGGEISMRHRSFRREARAPGSPTGKTAAPAAGA